MAGGDSNYTLTVEDDGLIVLDTSGVLSAKMLENILKDAEPILAKITRPRVLLRARGVGPPNVEGIRASIEYMRKTSIDRIATYSAMPERLFASKQAHDAVGMGDKFKLFRSEGDARAWLAEE